MPQGIFQTLSRRLPGALPVLALGTALLTMPTHAAPTAAGEPASGASQATTSNGEQGRTSFYERVTTPEETESLALAVGGKAELLETKATAHDEAQRAAPPATIPATSAYRTNYEAFMVEVNNGDRVVEYRSWHMGGGCDFGLAVIRDGKAVSHLHVGSTLPYIPD